MSLFNLWVPPSFFPLKFICWRTWSYTYTTICILLIVYSWLNSACSSVIWIWYMDPEVWADSVSTFWPDCIDHGVFFQQRAENVWFALFVMSAEMDMPRSTDLLWFRVSVISFPLISWNIFIYKEMLLPLSTIWLTSGQVHRGKEK